MKRPRAVMGACVVTAAITCAVTGTLNPQNTPSPAATSTASVSPDRRDLYFYHARERGSSFVRMGSAKTYDLEGQRQIQLKMPSGSQACVTVLNAHPVNYTYALGIAIDTSHAAIPVLPTQLTALGEFFPTVKDKTDPQTMTFLPEGMSEAAKAEALDIVKKLGNAVTQLAEQIREVEAAAKKSDMPEPLTAIDPEGPDTQRGYRAAQRAIADQKDGTGDFGSGQAKLTENFEVLAKEASEAAAKLKGTSLAEGEAEYQARLKTAKAFRNAARRKTEIARVEAEWGETRPKLVAADAKISEQKVLLALVIETLLARGKELAAKVGSISKAFEAEGRVELCGKVGTGPTTLTLKIVPKDGGYGSARDTKDKLVQEIIVRPPYGRETVSVHPVALAALAGNIPQFAVSNGTLIGPREDQIAYRVGAVVNVNVLSFGSDDVLGLGIAIGAGLTTESEVVSDLFVAGLVSFRDVIRIGLGVGASRFPSSVKGIAVGQPFDPNAGKLEDLVETSMKRAFHILFVLPGIKL